MLLSFSVVPRYPSPALQGAQPHDRIVYALRDGQVQYGRGSHRLRAWTEADGARLLN